MGAEQPHPLSVTGYGVVIIGILLAVVGAIAYGPMYLIGGMLIVITGLLVLMLRTFNEIQRMLSSRTTASPPE